jgi:hypothetical protein
MYITVDTLEVQYTKLVCHNNSTTHRRTSISQSTVPLTEPSSYKDTEQQNRLQLHTRCQMRIPDEIDPCQPISVIPIFGSSPREQSHAKWFAFNEDQREDIFPRFAVPFSNQMTIY